MLPVISPQEAFERFSKGEARLVDIRETDEYTQEFVPVSYTHLTLPTNSRV